MHPRAMLSAGGKSGFLVAAIGEKGDDRQEGARRPRVPSRHPSSLLELLGLPASARKREMSCGRSSLSGAHSQRKGDEERGEEEEDEG
ncbi:hypothetical protein DAI22_01g404600 [Oryza sativa Japonica Group]|jgi:hypothetical protein|nr:hypothetical protein DAI22_01g404600 [Oryza sativa Japonica Group]